MLVASVDLFPPRLSNLRFLRGFFRHRSAVIAPISLVQTCANSWNPTQPLHPRQHRKQPFQDLTKII